MKKRQQRSKELKVFIPERIIENKILLIRKRKVILDRDLAELYSVSTKSLNQAVKRNLVRFPNDFMFVLTQKERDQLVTNCDRFKSFKHSSTLPYAFTEQGVAILSSVLKSQKAVLVNIAIMRIFVKLREFLSTHRKLANKLKELKDHVGYHDKQIQAIFEAIRRLMKEEENPKNPVGFHM